MGERVDMALVFSRALVSILVGFFGIGAAHSAEKTYIYAASSMTGAVTTLIERQQIKTAHRYIPVFGASSTLARQIIQGAPAHIFITAHPDWMDQIINHNLIEPESLRNIAKNRLVIAAPVSNGLPLDMSDPRAFLARLAHGRMAISDPNHVPAGIYGKQALQNLGLWSGVKDRLAIASNVRITLSYIARAETALGIVYASDLYGQSDIKSVALIPEKSHSTIVYQIAVVREKATESARAFQRFLQSEKARAILGQFGFQPF